MDGIVERGGIAQVPVDLCSGFPWKSVISWLGCGEGASAGIRLEGRHCLVEVALFLLTEIPWP